MRILVAVHDLMFTSKINSVAKGHELTWLPRGTSVAAKAKELKPEVVLIDLGNAALKPAEAIAALKADPETKEIVVLAYVNHTEEALIAAARAAGCDQIFSKGEFSRRLPELLAPRS
jgi:DNA-binding NarL/FixJ family response regulator